MVGRKANASDEQIISAFKAERKSSGREPNLNKIRLLTGASYALIERVLTDYKNNGESFEKFLAAREDNAQRELSRWFAKALLPVVKKFTQHMASKEDLVREEFSQQAMLDCENLEKAQAQIKKLNRTIEKQQEEVGEARTSLKESLAMQAEQQVKLDAKAEAIGTFKAKLHSAEDSLAEKNTTITTMTRNHNRALEEHHQKFASIRGSFDKALTAHEGTQKVLKEDIIELKEKLKVVEETKNQAIEDKEAAEEAQSQAEETLETTQAQLTTLEQSTVKNLETEVKEANAITKTRDKTIQRLEGEVKPLRESHTTLKQEHQKLKKAHELLGGVRIDLERNNAQLEYRLQAEGSA